MFLVYIMPANIAICMDLLPWYKNKKNKKLVPLPQLLFATFFAGLKMAFRVIKQRREARRNAKLEEIFLERDKLQDETMSCQDMQDVFRMYGVRDILIDIMKDILRDK